MAGGSDVAPWPEPSVRDEAAEADMTLVMDIIRAIRNARAEYNVQPGQGIPAAISAGDQEALIRDQAEIDLHAGAASIRRG